MIFDHFEPYISVDSAPFLLGGGGITEKYQYFSISAKKNFNFLLFQPIIDFFFFNAICGLLLFSAIGRFVKGGKGEV